METWIQPILLLGNNKQKVVTDSYSYLCEDCIHSRSVEGFDVQVLLDPFEKDLNLPSFAICSAMVIASRVKLLVRNR